MKSNKINTTIVITFFVLKIFFVAFKHIKIYIKLRQILHGHIVEQLYFS